MTTSWKQWRTCAERNSKGAGASAFKTAEAIRELFKSREFVDECHNRVLDNATEELSTYAGRFGMYVHEMLAMIDHFPNEVDWDQKSLRRLYDETCKAIGKKKGTSAVRKSRDEVIKQLRDENRQLKAENRKLKAALEKVKKEVFSA
jgi:hypothetical protein